MAEAFFQVLIDNLTSLIQREVGLIIGVDKDMKKLSKSLITIQKVLEDAEDKQFHSKAVQNWLGELNGMAFEIEDILDECQTELAKFNRRGSNFNLKKVLFRYNIGRRMKEAVEKLEAIAEDRHKFHFREIVVQQSNQIDWRRATGSVVNEPDHVYGRDDDRDRIVDLLVNQVSDQKLSVLPIIGMGGMGKTTLAQLIYNDDRINQHFDNKLWVCVSDHFDLIAIIRALIESVTGKQSKLENLDSLQRRLREELSEKKYLLILDDVWNENQEDWVRLKSTLACGSVGASIVVTTRVKKVADIMGTLPTYCLAELLEEHCWLLFKLRAFGQEDVQHRGNLEAIGRRIVKKCAGVPLAAKALGGLLRFKRDEKEWIHVEESSMWNLPEEENSILPVLRLSYRHLPFLLKRCFVYCAVFPKDYEFEKTQLIFHWMSHGCISTNGTREVEDVGDQIWNELTLRSFFLEVNPSGRRTIFKMHDLVHDLAQSIMENKIPRAETESSNRFSSDNRIRQLSLWLDPFLSNSRIPVKVSTISVEHFTNSVEFCPLITVKYDRLRILRLRLVDGVKELPCALGKLKHLRCLDLEYSFYIPTLPPTFHCLHNLQILVLNHCSNLKSLPKNIINMTNLRHIFLEGCDSLSHMPRRIGELTSLKTLSLFIVEDKNGHKLDELEHLNLGGRLQIKHLESVQNHMNAKKANLVGKPGLHDLVLHWGVDRKSFDLSNDEKVLEALEPHLNLATMEIRGFHGHKLALWITKMKNLTMISLDNCRNCRHLPPLGDLPLLKTLCLSNLDMLEYVLDEDDTGTKFPLLEELYLKGLHNLKGLLKEKEVGESFPNLKEVTCQHMIPPSFSFQKLTNLSKLFLDFEKIDDATWKNVMLEDALEGLCNLKKLSVWHLLNHRLPEKWFQGLNGLTKLSLLKCKIESCFPEGWLRHLIALEQLSVYNCSGLVDVIDEIRHLHLLKRLKLCSTDEIVSLPLALQQLPSLQYLRLGTLEKLTSLPDWLADLQSLTQLEIQKCPAIPSLPSPIFKHLEWLEIWECPQLQRRCQKPNGEDWHKIAHIPHLEISEG